MEFEPVKEAIPDGVKIERDGEKTILRINAVTDGQQLKIFGLVFLCILLIPFAIVGIGGSLKAGAPLGALGAIIVLAGAIYFIKKSWTQFDYAMKIEIDDVSVSFSGKRYDINHWNGFLLGDVVEITRKKRVARHHYIDFKYGGKKEKSGYFVAGEPVSDIVLYINRITEERQAPKKEMPGLREQKF